MRQSLVVLLIVLLFVGLVAQRMWSYTTSVVERVEHQPGHHTGHLISLGGDRFHAEIVVMRDGTLKLFLLDRNGSRPAEAAAQPLSALVTLAGDDHAQTVELRPEPQVGDAAGMTSFFVGTLPTSSVGAVARVVVPNLSLGGERFHLSYENHATEYVEMPTAVAEAEGRVLYLTAAGKYTDADIAANGGTTAAQKFRNFRARHDRNPQTGDPLCPVTGTKANPDCTWVVAGETYRFCCPPCIDEFIRLAKEEPDKVLAPDEYVKR